MMRQMRENTKWIMLIVAVAFVALMVFEWGMDLSGRNSAQASGGELGRVNGEPITAVEYEAAYRNLYNQQQQGLDEPISPAMARQIREAAWEQLITQKLLEQELRRRGIVVTDEEILQAARLSPPPELQSAPAFQTDGQFDITKYHAFLATPSLDETFLNQLELYYRDVIPRSKLYFQTTAGVHLSDGQLWRLYQDANETATVQYVSFSPDVLVREDEIAVTDAAVREYYGRNREQFVRPAQANVRYVVMNRLPSTADSAAARQRAAELRNAAVGGESFEAVARRASGVDSVSRFYGELFRVGRGQSAPALEQAVFATPVGQVSEPVLTGAGYHLIRIETRSGDTAQVRQILVPIELSVENETRLLNRADSLENAAETAGLDRAAESLGLQVRTAEFSPALPILPGLGTADEAIAWVFEEARIGEVSPVFETEAWYYVVELVSRRDEGALSLQEATPTIRAVLQRQAKIAKARERLGAADGAARSGRPLEEIARTYNATVQQAGPFSRGDLVPGLGRLNAAIGAAFGLKPGQISPLIEADGQLFLIQLVERVDADREAFEAQKALQRAQVQQALADARWQQYMAAVRESAEIVDNRAELQRQARMLADSVR